MRTYPTLTEQATSRDFIDVFGGYNHNLRIEEGEFYDMKNLSSTNYPILSTRSPRGTYLDSSQIGFTPVGMIDKDGLWTAEVDRDSDDNWFLLLRMPGNNVSQRHKTRYDSTYKRTLVSMGAYIVILPDKVYVNTTDIGKTDEFNKEIPLPINEIEASFISDNQIQIEAKDTETNETIWVDSGYYATYEMCKADGAVYEIDKESDTQPTGLLKNGYVWLDTSTKPHSLKVYSTSNGMWSSVATTYVRITCVGIGKNFEVGDAVRITGVNPGRWEGLNSSEKNVASIIQAKGDDYIVVIGVMNEPKYTEESDVNGDEIIDEGEGVAEIIQDTKIEVKRVMPDMDFVFENGNRLWGCRYGINRDDEIVNEIYASKLGDFKNWESFGGTSMDSYVASLGADGEFTGAISYLGNPLFFKQGCIHLVYGSYPAQYQIQTTECRGVQQGCHNSLVMINGTLYYKAMGGVCAYTGSLPTEIGSALGEQGKRFYGAYGGVYRGKYYLGMHDALYDEDTTWLYVYDTEKGMWHKEDEYNGQEFCYCDSGAIDQLYYLSPYKDGEETRYNVKTIVGEGKSADTEKIDWFFETGVMGCSSADKKYVSRISLRLSTEIGARVFVFAEYDSLGEWEQIGVMSSSSLNTFTFPVRPKRCDHFRLRIVGTGAAKIYSISKTIEQGGDV